MAGSGDDGAKFANISATPASFSLLGGTYAVTVSATWGGGSVTLNSLAGDNATEIAVLPAFSSNGYASLNLGPGLYQFAIATATAVYADIHRVRRM